MLAAVQGQAAQLLDRKELFNCCHTWCAALGQPRVPLSSPADIPGRKGVQPLQAVPRHLSVRADEPKVQAPHQHVELLACRNRLTTLRHVLFETQVASVLLE